MPSPRTSHRKIEHASIASLGYDWSRVAGQDEPRYPLAIYLPETTADVAVAVQECMLHERRVRIRGRGHSSNDLVVSDRGALLLTERLDAIGPLDRARGTITVGAGISLGLVDAHLADHGLGLPIMPDHPDISAGGYASAGGLSPASHRFGLFADTIAAAEYVDWSGRVSRVDRDRDPMALRRLLAAVGRHGVITELTCDVIAIAKHSTIMRNDRRIVRDFPAWAQLISAFAAQPGDARFARGVWLDAGAGKPQFGQLSVYRRYADGLAARVRNRACYGALHRIGGLCGRLPERPAAAVKLAGSLLGMIATPRYGSIRNIEQFTDKIIDYTVGDPARMFVVLAPARTFEAIANELHEQCCAVRDASGALTFLAIHFKAINSAFLAGGDEPERYGELMLVTGIEPERYSDELLATFVREVDALCVKHEAVRLLHTKSTMDPRVDPNARYAAPASVAEVA